jgi:biotin carboxyl carrier protein
LRFKLPQAICGHNKKPGAPALHDVRITNASALPIEVGGNIGDGDDIAFVEAMKMEIPVASPAAGRLKTILVSIDDVVAEGQVLAIVEI